MSPELSKKWFSTSWNALQQILICELKSTYWLFFIFVLAEFRFIVLRRGCRKNGKVGIFDSARRNLHRKRVFAATHAFLENLYIRRRASIGHSNYYTLRLFWSPHSTSAIEMYVWSLLKYFHGKSASGFLWRFIDCPHIFLPVIRDVVFPTKDTSSSDSFEHLKIVNSIWQWPVRLRILFWCPFISRSDSLCIYLLFVFRSKQVFSLASESSRGFYT